MNKNLIKIIFFSIITFSLLACSAHQAKQECPYMAAKEKCEAGCKKSCKKLKDMKAKKKSSKACCEGKGECACSEKNDCNSCDSAKTDCKC